MWFCSSWTENEWEDEECSGLSFICTNWWHFFKDIISLFSFLPFGFSAELGDYDPRRHSLGYVTEFRFLANQTAELESRIVELHKTLVWVSLHYCVLYLGASYWGFFYLYMIGFFFFTFRGQLPSAAELNYLDKVKWLEMYGVDLHPVLVNIEIQCLRSLAFFVFVVVVIFLFLTFQGEDNVEYFLGLTPSGIILLRNKTKVGNYYWPRINKMYYKVSFINIFNSCYLHSCCLKLIFRFLMIKPIATL